MTGKRKLIALMSLACALQSRGSDGVLKLADVFSDHMVLQRGQPVPVWGWAEPNVEIAVEFGGQKKTANSSSEGAWRVKLDPLSASAEPRTLRVSTTGVAQPVTRKDVLVGDVWLASGQSNMDVALFWTQKGKAEAAAANYPLIRYFKVGTVASDTPKDTLHGSWSLCVAKSAEGFTELGYYYARQLFEKLHVPVGIINSSYGGTSIEAWMDAKALAADRAGPAVYERWSKVLKEYPDKRAGYEKAKAAWASEKDAAKVAGTAFNKQAPFPPNGPGSQYTPSGLYNAMIHPLVPYAIRGVIWYQGENNVKRPEEYRSLFPSLIRSWRLRFGQGDLPFYWVQLPNYNIGAEANWPGLREAQSQALSLPNTGQAVTVDIGDGRDVHPANKEEVARRLARIAFARTYGDAALVDSGPIFDCAEFGKEVRIHFKQVAAGLEVKEGATTVGGFQLAGADKVFRAADARVEEKSNSVVVSSDLIASPVAVRYAWTNNPQHLSLVNSEGLPLAPFRTDDW